MEDFRQNRHTFTERSFLIKLSEKIFFLCPRFGSQIDFSELKKLKEEEIEKLDFIR